MTKEPLPVFVYHPDPLDTGSIVESDDVCLVCGRMRGYLYRGPVHGRNTGGIDDNICPWCIADGSAHELYGVSFTLSIGYLPSTELEPIPEEVEEEISFRTPGYTAWQEEYWWAHCGDGAMFLGSAGTKELNERWPEAMSIIREDIQQWGWDEQYKKDFMTYLRRDDMPCAYVLKRRHCGKFGAFWDWT